MVKGSSESSWQRDQREEAEKLLRWFLLRMRDKVDFGVLSLLCNSCFLSFWLKQNNYIFLLWFMWCPKYRNVVLPMFIEFLANQSSDGKPGERREMLERRWRKVIWSFCCLRCSGDNVVRCNGEDPWTGWSDWNRLSWWISVARIRLSVGASGHQSQLHSHHSKRKVSTCGPWPLPGEVITAFM